MQMKLITFYRLLDAGGHSNPQQLQKCAIYFFYLAFILMGYIILMGIPHCRRFNRFPRAGRLLAMTDSDRMRLNF